MKIILETEGVKREIEAPFNICGSSQDLKLLCKQLNLICDVTNFHYGWNTIYPEPKAVPDEHPRKWDE